MVRHMSEMPILRPYDRECLDENLFLLMYRPAIAVFEFTDTHRKLSRPNLGPRSGPVVDNPEVMAKSRNGS